MNRQPSPKITEYQYKYKYKMNCLEILLFHSVRNALYYREGPQVWCVCVVLTVKERIYVSLQ